MVSINVTVRYVILVTSLALFGLSLATFYLTGNAFFTLARDYPPDRYVWYGPDQDAYTNYHMVRLSYDWTTENLVWVTSGMNVVAGILGLVIFFSSLRQAKNQSVYAALPKVVSWTRIPAIALTAIAFITTLVCFIWASVHRINLKNSTCNPKDGERDNNLFFCTRELVACDIGQLIISRAYDRRWYTAEPSCKQIKGSRMIMIPLFVVSLVLVAAYGVQIYSDRKAEAERAEARVERLQEEE